MLIGQRFDRHPSHTSSFSVTKIRMLRRVSTYLGHFFETIDPLLFPLPLHQSPSHSRALTVQAPKPQQCPRERMLLTHTLKNLTASSLLRSIKPLVRTIILRSRTRPLLRGDPSAHDLPLTTLMMAPRALDIDTPVTAFVLSYLVIAVSLHLCIQMYWYLLLWLFVHP